MSKSPNFIIQNPFGVYYFQRRIPEKFLNRTKGLPKIIRLSLRTKDKKVAHITSRLLSVMFDLRAQQYFKDEENYHRGMKLLQEYIDITAKYSKFEEIEEYFLNKFDDVTDYESKLLDSAIKYHKSVQLDHGHSLIEKRFENIESYLRNSIQTTHTTKVVKVNQKIITEAIEEFLEQKKINWSGKGGMEEDYRTIYFPLFIELVGNVETSQLTKSNINDFIKVVLHLPSNRHKKKNYKSLFAKDFLNISVPISDRLSQNSQSKYLNHIGSFLKWLKSNDYTDVDLHLPLTNVKFKKVRANEQRNIFTKSDLRKLFNSEQYIKGLHKEASQFWVPLIAIYTGARLNEICQLSLNDIYIDESTQVWVFDINENKEDDPLKSIKRPYHARLIPVHKKLIKLGFLDFIKNQRQRKYKKLFPELPYVGISNKYGANIQRWFNRTYKLSKCKITTEGTSFHSLRHNVITHLVNDKNVDPNKIAIGLGQTPVGGVTLTTYTKKLPLKDYLQYFQQIDFDDSFDLTKIKDWKRNLFNQTDGLSINILKSTKPTKSDSKKTPVKKTRTRPSTKTVLE